jgi:hypothetical protein
MTFTMEDFVRQYIQEHFAKLTPEEQRKALKRLSPEQRREVVQSLSAEERLAGLPTEERLAGLSEEQIQHYLDQLIAHRPTQRRKPRRKK